MTILGHEITSYYIAMLLGFLAMNILMVLRRERFGLSKVQAILFTCLLMFSGVLGTKVMYAIENGGSFEGFSFFGAVFLIPPLMILFGRLFRMSPLQSLDACAPCVVLILAVMRVGCLINGCCGGWACTIGGFTFHWPTQITEMALDVCILGMLLKKEASGEARNRLYFLFMGAYGLIRFIIEFFRVSSTDYLLHMSHLWAAISLIAGLSIYFEMGR